MPTFLFHRMGQILLRPAILWVSAQQNSCKRNVGKALPVMNGIGMAGECSQESENNAQTKAKNVPNTPRQSGTLDCKPTEQRADWCAEREVWAWSRWRKTLHILFLISSLHADMWRSEQTEMTPDSVYFVSCSLIRLSYIWHVWWRPIWHFWKSKSWKTRYWQTMSWSFLYYTEFTYYIYYTHFWADIGMHEILRNHELEFSILYRMYILHILYPLLSRYWYAVSWITPSPALISMWHFSRRPIWHFWSQSLKTSFGETMIFYTFVRRYWNTAFCFASSQALSCKGQFSRKKRSWEIICSLCRCNCCVSSHCCSISIGGLALGGWDTRKWWALLRREDVWPWGGGEPQLRSVLGVLVNPRRGGVWPWGGGEPRLRWVLGGGGESPGVGGVWPWGGGEPRLRSVLGGGGEPPGVGGVWPWGGGEPRLRSVLGGGGEPRR